MPTQVFLPVTSQTPMPMLHLTISPTFARKIFIFIKETIGNSLRCLERLAARPAVFSCFSCIEAILLAEPLGSLAFLVQVSLRRSRWDVEFGQVATC
ncbi:ABC transporter G family member 17 [Dorcoceras hygrometricum]|uniref:ABC transporter G family member 17 n=1 Tax=Dorcoceras hygrometricum TaxID=472368 RepID=A0A2Z7CQF1_9LAMI|nr:ABC transporter G family member 17 [Dorcoceras hygrometricum]